MMLYKPDATDQVVALPVRVTALDRARTFITVLVVLHPAVINYTYYGSDGDRMRWLGFDLIVLFNDSFFMACMFFISGLFVHDSLTRRQPQDFLRRRAAGMPDFSFPQFWWHTLTIGPWSSGSAWFLWVLLALDAFAALLWVTAPRAMEGLGQLIFAV